METNPQEILDQAYAAFNSRDIPGVLRWMRPDVRWPKAFEGGHVSGRDAVQAYWQRQWSEIDPHVEPMGYRNRADGSVAVSVHQVVKDPSGAVLADGHVIHVYTFEDGLIQEMNVESD